MVFHLETIPTFTSPISKERHIVYNISFLSNTSHQFLDKLLCNNNGDKVQKLLKVKLSLFLNNYHAMKIYPLLN